jgi:hypothetical protein
MNRIERSLADALYRKYNGAIYDPLRLARNAIEALAGVSDITDDEIGDAILEGDRGRYIWADAYYEPDGIVAVRALLTKQRALDAAKIAQLEQELAESLRSRNANV